MRDNSEPLIATQDADEPEQEPAQTAEPPGSGSTKVAQSDPSGTALGVPSVAEASLEPVRHDLRLAPERARSGSSASNDSDAGTVGLVRHDAKSSSPKRTTISDTRDLAPKRATARPTSAGDDPVGRIFALMERERRVGMTIGLIGALLLHGAGVAHGYSSLLDMSAFAGAVRSAVSDDVRATYAVEMKAPPPPPPPPAAPDPEPPKPQPQPRAAAPQPQQSEKPPAPAQAAKVLTAEPDANEPLDLTDQGFVTGDGDRFAGGVTSSTGTSKTAVRDINAKPGGVVGGKGTAAAPPAPPREDLSRAATPASRDWGDCGFPAEADVEQIDFMRLSIVVTVGTDGRAQNVTVLKDPGYGFGNQARQCAMRKTYNTGLNAEGKPIVTTTPPFIVTFRR